MECPKCYSKNTRTFSVVYEQGAHLSSTETTRDDGRTYTHMRSSTSQLASRCSPPDIPQYSSALFIFSLIVSIVPAFAAAGFVKNEKIWVGLAVFITMMYLCRQLEKKYLFKPKTHKYQNDLAMWKQSWLCMRCGHDYVDTNWNPD